MKEFKLRASKAGDLMTNGRGKDTMGETCKNYLKEWVISEFTGKQKRIRSKYLTKGINAEPMALKRIGNYYGVELKKNEKRLKNDYFTGEFDTMTKDIVIDAKCSWDAFTFPFFVTEIERSYYLQLQIYMELTGLKKASLCYCLENGTDEEIEKLSWEYAKENGHDEPDIDDWEQAEKELNYDHLPESARIKVFEFDYEPAIIEELKQRVIDARVYIKNELLPHLSSDSIIMSYYHIHPPIR